MTATEVRDRLDHRFKCLSALGVVWSAIRRWARGGMVIRPAPGRREGIVLIRCSVFAGGLNSKVPARSGSDEVDEYAILDLLDALGS